MYYKKNAKGRAAKSYIYSLSDFSKGINRDVDENALSMDYAYMAYNLKYDDKTLKHGHGFADLKLPDGLHSGQWHTFQAPTSSAKPLRVWNVHITADGSGADENLILVYCDDGYIYMAYVNDYAPIFTRIQVKFTSEPTIINYKYNDKYVAVICSPTDKMYLWNLTATPVNSSKDLHLVSTCSHYERIFATTSDNKRQVRFSKDLDITNWSETSDAGGFIELVDERGNINKVISFNDYVYLIRDFGISRLSAYGDQSEFSVTHILQTSNMIYSNTAALCGDRIVYLATDGLYYCVGANVYRCNLKINNLIDAALIKNACACYFNGKYYLSIRLNFQDGKTVGCESESGYKNNALIEFDLKTGKLNIFRGVDVRAMESFVYDGWQKLVALFNGAKSQKIGELTDDGKLFDANLPKCWQSPMGDLGSLNEKVVRSVSLITPANVTIKVKSEQEAQILNVCGAPKLQTLVCNVKGVRVGVEIETTAQTVYVSNVAISLDVLK